MGMFRHIALTNEKTIAANALYAACVTLQNAARLQYPAGTERARFFLEEFPPHATAKNPTAGRKAETPRPPNEERRHSCGPCPLLIVLIGKTNGAAP